MVVVCAVVVVVVGAAVVVVLDVVVVAAAGAADATPLVVGAGPAESAKNGRAVGPEHALVNPPRAAAISTRKRRPLITSLYRPIRRAREGSWPRLTERARWF